MTELTDFLIIMIKSIFDSDILLPVNSNTINWWEFWNKIYLKFTIEHILAFLTLFVSYYGINGIIIRDRNKYINLLKTYFPELNTFSKILYNYKMFIRVSPFLILPLSIVLCSYFCYSILFLLALLDMFRTHFSGTVTFPGQFLNISALIIISFYALGCNLIKTKKLLPQKAMNFSEFKKSMIFVYSFYWVMMGFATIFFLFYSYFFIVPWIGGFYFDYLFNILNLLMLIITGYFLIDLIKRIAWFHTKVPKMLIDSLKLDLPFMKIKTDGEEITGIIQNLYHPNFLTLIEGNELCFIPWDKVKVIKFSYNNQHLTLKTIEAPGAQKEPWYKFWK